MKPEEAHRYLSAARPHGQDENDPRIAAARAALASDSARRESAAQAAEEDARRAALLQQTPVPDGLRASLREQMAAATQTPRPRAAQAQWGWWVAAAAIVLSAVGLWRWQWVPQAEFNRTADFREAMAVYIAEVPFQLDYTSQHLAAIQQWLTDSQVPAMPAIPSRLAGRIPLGCKQIQWNNVTVSLVCFYDSIPENRIVHLFIAPRSALSEQAIGDIEASLVARGFDTRGWQTDEWVCVLVPSSRDMRVSPLLDQPEFVRPA